MDGIIYLTLEQAEQIHRKTITYSGGGTYEPLDVGKLDSVLQHIQNDLYYPTFVDKLTHLFFCTCEFHCFADGNKRLAITLSLQFLLFNGYLGIAQNFMKNLIYQPKEGISGKEIPRKKTRLNSEGIRVMTPMEWGRLQGFIGYGFLDADGSETFSFPEGTNDAQKYKQFGNSVSIPVIKTMADFMLNCFDILEQQQEEIVKALAYQNVYITKKAVMENLGINAVQASAILKKLIEQQEIRRISHGVSTRYVNANREDDLPPFSQEEKVLEYAKENDSFSNKDIVELLQITVGSGNVLLSTMVKKGLLIRVKRGWYSEKV